MAPAGYLGSNRNILWSALKVSLWDACHAPSQSCSLDGYVAMCVHDTHRGMCSASAQNSCICSLNYRYSFVFYVIISKIHLDFKKIFSKNVLIQCFLLLCWLPCASSSYHHSLKCPAHFISSFVCVCFLFLFIILFLFLYLGLFLWQGQFMVVHVDCSVLSWEFLLSGASCVLCLPEWGTVGQVALPSPLIVT